MGSFGLLAFGAVIWLMLPVWGLAGRFLLQPRRGCSYRCLYGGFGASPAILSAASDRRNS